MLSELNQEVTRIFSQYKNGNTLQKQAILLDLVKELTEAKHAIPQTDEQVIAASKQLVFARALLHYAQRFDTAKPKEKYVEPKPKKMVCATLANQYLFEIKENQLSLPQVPADINDHEIMRYWIELFIKNTQANLLDDASKYYLPVDMIAINTVIDKVTSSEACPMAFPRAIQDQEPLKTQWQIKEFSRGSITILEQAIQLIDRYVKTPNIDAETIKACARLRARLLFETFQLTTLYPELVTWSKQHIVNDSQYYHFGLELDKYLNNASLRSKAIDNSDLVAMSLFAALQQADSVNDEDLLAMLYNDIQTINKSNGLYCESYFNAKEYAGACDLLILQAKETFDSFKPDDIDELWQNAYAAFAYATAELSLTKRTALKRAAQYLQLALSDPELNAEEKNIAYDFFVADCETILNGEHPAIMKILFTIFAVVVATVVSFAIGFTLGFLFGFWSGPAAFATALVGGSMAATAVVTATGASAIAAGLVASIGVFGEKKHPYVENFVNDVRVIDQSNTAETDITPSATSLDL